MTSAVSDDNKLYDNLQTDAQFCLIFEDNRDSRVPWL